MGRLKAPTGQETRGSMREEEIRVYDRRKKARVPVQTAAAKWMRTLYDTRPGNWLLWALIKRRCVSAIYGRYCRTRHSRRAAQALIDQYGLDMSAYAPFETYRDFFIRQKRDVAFPQGDRLGSIAESFLTAWEHIDPARLYQVKDSTYTLARLLGDEETAQVYEGGTLLRFRLAPHHYHHLHLFDEAEVTRLYDVKGAYYSVHPMAAVRIAELYCKNKRRVVHLNTTHFGRVVLVEVGATMVAGIHNPFAVGDTVHRGQDGGYFEPGGSMLLLLFAPGTVQICQDILEQSKEEIETMVSVGERIGTRVGH